MKLCAFLVIVPCWVGAHAAAQCDFEVFAKPFGDSLALADVDGDAALDIVVSLILEVGVLTSKGDGTFPKTLRFGGTGVVGRVSGVAGEVTLDPG
jgi:hypothetical protein